MIADIGLIVGLYALWRMVVFLLDERERVRAKGAAWVPITVTIVLAVVVALLTLDIFLLGTDWLAQETESLR